MALPAQVQAQADEARKLEQEIFGEGQTDEPGDGDIQPPDTHAVTTTPDTPPTVPAAPDVAALQRELDEANQRYRTIDGKYKAEVPELHARIRQLEAILGSMQATAPRKDTQTPTAPTTPEELETFKEEYPDFYRGVVALVSAELSKVQQPVTETVQNLAQTVAQDKLDRYYARLGQLAPEWRALNNDPKFLEWLNASEKYSGYTRAQLISGKHSIADADGVAQFFNDYKEEVAGHAASTGTPTQKKPPLAPPSSGTSTPVGSLNQGDKRLIPESEVSRFYNTLSMPSTRNSISKEDRQRLENEYAMAALEGRILKGQ